MLFYLCGNVYLKMRRFSALDILKHIVFSQFCCFLRQSYGLGLGFRLGLYVDPVLYQLDSTTELLNSIKG